MNEDWEEGWEEGSSAAAEDITELKLEIGELEVKLKAALAIVDKLLKTEDGVPITPNAKVWLPAGTVEKSGMVTITTSKTQCVSVVAVRRSGMLEVQNHAGVLSFVAASDCYSRSEKAEEAHRNQVLS